MNENMLVYLLDNGLISEHQHNQSVQAIHGHPVTGLLPGLGGGSQQSKGC